MGDLWDNVLTGDFTFGEGDSLDAALGEDGAYLRFASSLPPEREPMTIDNWLGDEPRSGVRVAFQETLESLLCYQDFPSPGIGREQAEGTVVRIRTSSGDATSIGSRVFVQWDDGKLRMIDRRHLMPAASNRRVASNFRRVVSNLGDLTGFFRGNQGTDLVHKATQDLWSFRKDGEGYVIERLFDASGEPLKGV